MISLLILNSSIDDQDNELQFSTAFHRRRVQGSQYHRLEAKETLRMAHGLVRVA